MQREKDQKLDELNHVRSHDMACRKLKHRLDLDLKRDKARPLLFNSLSGCLSNVNIAINVLCPVPIAGDCADERMLLSLHVQAM